MPGIFRPRHLERTALYRVIFHHFERFVAFITDDRDADRIIEHLKLTFVAEKPPSSHVLKLLALMAAEEAAEYF